jgi:hypothetical protein
MTIIAISATHAAADGMRVWGSEIRSLSTKKLSIIDNPPSGGHRAIVAFCGSTPLQAAVIDWWRSGFRAADAPKCDGCDWELLTIDRFGLKRFISSCPYPESFDAPMAAGTGVDMAIGALLCGRTAREAVELVCDRHTVCGGEIQVLDIMEVTGFTLATPVPKEDMLDNKAAHIISRAGLGIDSWADSRQVLRKTKYLGCHPTTCSRPDLCQARGECQKIPWPESPVGHSD